MPKAAAIQMTSTNSLKHNLSVARKLLKQACDAGAKLAVLPEMFPIQSPEAKSKLAIAEPLGEGEIQSFLSEQAKKNELWIVGGTIPIRTQNNNKVYAASLVVDAQGKHVAHYNKIHLFDVCISPQEQYRESATTEPGNHLCIVDTPIGRLGLAVCYDIRFPEMFRCLFNQGAEIFAIPCAFTQKTGKAHFETLMRARAIENFSYLIGACQTGDHGHGRSTYGHSLIVSPWGNLLAELPDNEGIIVAEIDLPLLKQIRTDLPVKEHQTMILNESIFALTQKKLTR
jgi:nitrilase